MVAAFTVVVAAVSELAVDKLSVDKLSGMRE